MRPREVHVALLLIVLPLAGSLPPALLSSPAARCVSHSEATLAAVLRLVSREPCSPWDGKLLGLRGGGPDLDGRSGGIGKGRVHEVSSMLDGWRDDAVKEDSVAGGDREGAGATGAGDGAPDPFWPHGLGQEALAAWGGAGEEEASEEDETHGLTLGMSRMTFKDAAGVHQRDPNS